MPVILANSSTPLLAASAGGLILTESLNPGVEFQRLLENNTPRILEDGSPRLLEQDTQTSSAPAPRFGGAFAPWAIEAKDIADHPNSAALVAEIYAIVPGRFNININPFAPAIYQFDFSTANTIATFNRTTTIYGGNLDTGALVPWNEPDFVTPGELNPADTDSHTSLVDTVTGRTLEFFESDYDEVNNVLSGGRGHEQREDIDGLGPVANIFTKQNGSRSARACGIQHTVGPVLRSEIDAGYIPHCIPMNYPQPTQFAFEAPATKGAGFTGGGPNRGFMGLRIAWDGLTQTDIDDWVATLVPIIQGPMRTVAECLRDFGGIVMDNAGNPALQRGATQFENQVTGRWDEIGLTQQNILTALHTLLEPNQSKARALAIPTFLNGNIQNVACYPGVAYPPEHPCSGAF